MSLVQQHLQGDKLIEVEPSIIHAISSHAWTQIVPPRWRERVCFGGKGNTLRGSMRRSRRKDSRSAKAGPSSEQRLRTVTSLCVEVAQGRRHANPVWSSDAGASLSLRWDPTSIIHGGYHHHRFALIAPSSWAHYFADKRGQSRLMRESYGAQDENRCAIFRDLAFCNLGLIKETQP
jgi:hypothetical protein